MCCCASTEAMAKRKLVLLGQSCLYLRFEIKIQTRRLPFASVELHKRQHRRHDFAAPQLTKLGIGRKQSLVSPIGLVDIYPSVPRNTDPRAVPSRASAKRRSHLSADHSSLRRAAPPCLNQSSAEGEAWCHRSVSSISTHLCRETPIRAPFHRVRAPNV